MEKWLIPSLGQAKYKMSLGHLMVLFKKEEEEKRKGGATEKKEEPN